MDVSADGVKCSDSKSMSDNQANDSSTDETDGQERKELTNSSLTEISKSQSFEPYPTMTFEQLTREADVQFFTGFRSSAIFKIVFEFLQPVASGMTYWEEDPDPESDHEESAQVPQTSPERKITLEQEFLLTLMRLSLGHLTEDLAFQFGITNARVDSIFFSWIRLINLSMKSFIPWASRACVRRHLPDCFEKYYPQCRVIIDVSEVYIERPSDPETAASLWTSYRHDYVSKFLIGVTPVGAVTFLSDCYVGSATDQSIIEKSGLAEKLTPGDYVLAMRNYNVKEWFAFNMCRFAVPPLCFNVSDKSSVGNIRTYMQKSINRIKEYRILKTVVSVQCSQILKKS